MDGTVPYVRDYLVDNATPYQGPWVGDNNGGKGLESIQCTDEHNIVFHLSKPVGDFGYTVALSTFAPVLPEKDTHLDYEKHPYSNGPYKLVGDLDPDKGLTLVRNGFWTETNDQVRKAYPDKIVFDFRADDSGVITNQLIEDQGDARNTVMLDANVAPNFLQQVVNDPDLVKHAITGPTGAIRYFAINTKVVTEHRLPAGADLRVRQAQVPRGRRRFGQRRLRDHDHPAGHQRPQELRPVRQPGQPGGRSRTRRSRSTKAQAAAGKPCPSVIKVAFPDTPLRRRQLNTVVEAYQLAGIQVAAGADRRRAPTTRPASATPTNQYAMMIAGWVPDWANGSAILPAAVRRRRRSPKVNPVTGHSANNTNFSLLNDPRSTPRSTGAQARPTRTARPPCGATWTSRSRPRRSRCR